MNYASSSFIAPEIVFACFQLENRFFRFSTKGCAGFGETDVQVFGDRNIIWTANWPTTVWRTSSQCARGFTILSKEQLRDQLVDRLGCREEETEIVVALSSGLVGSYLREEHLTWGGSWTWHLSCHSTARGPPDPLPRLAVSPFHVWPVPFLQIQFSSPAAFWCQLLHRLDIESDSGLNQLVVCVLQSPLSMTLVHSTSQRCLWHTRT